jgi:hypothetical protein
MPSFVATSERLATAHGNARVTTTRSCAPPPSPRLLSAEERACSPEPAQRSGLGSYASAP